MNGFLTKYPNIRYIIPIIRVMIPFQRYSPFLVNIATSPTIIRNRPAKEINNPATKLKRAGFIMNPKPNIRAIIPNTISKIPKLELSFKSPLPTTISPIPNRAKAKPAKILTAINPNSGSAKTIIPKIINNMAVVFLFMHPYPLKRFF